MTKTLFSLQLCFLLCFFGLVLLSSDAAAHHVYGIEVSPAFELVHGLVEPVLFALSGACLAAFLSRRAPARLLVALVFSFVFGFVGLGLALASVIEEGVGLFLLSDALAGGVFFALVRRGRMGVRRNAKLF